MRRPEKLSGLVFMVMKGIVDFCAIFGHKTSFKEVTASAGTLSFHFTKLRYNLIFQPAPGRDYGWSAVMHVMTRKGVTRLEGSGR